MEYEPDYVLSPPFQLDRNALRNGTPFVGQSAVEDESIVIVNNGWFPDVVVRDFRQRRQIDDTHATERVIDVLQSAITQINDELASYTEAQIKLGFKALEDIPAMKLGSSNTKVLSYFRAVYSTAQAMLNYRYWAVADTVGKNHSNNTGLLSESADEYQRERWESLQLLRGEKRTITGTL